MSKYRTYLEKILDMYSMGLSKAEIARRLKEEYGLPESEDTVRRSVSRVIHKAEPIDKDEFIEAFAVENKIPLDNITSYWYKGEHVSVKIKNPSNELDWKKIQEEMVDTLASYRPSFEHIQYDKCHDGHCLVIDPADVHIGKLADSFETGCDYDSQTAVSRVKEGIRGILQKSSGFDIEQIVFVGGNDILHIDSPQRKTTSGTPQDTDGMWFRNYKIAQRLYIDVIGSLLKIAPVHFVFNPSNHDYTHGFFLSDMICNYFENHGGFTCDADLQHRKYYVYGNNLIGTTHGDGAKNQDLPLLMATEAPNEWARTKHRYVYTHHVHHKSSKDFQGVTVESMRSPSGTDSWHHRNGYQHAPKAMEGFIHHPTHGQVARITHLF